MIFVEIVMRKKRPWVKTAGHHGGVRVVIWAMIYLKVGWYRPHGGLLQLLIRIVGARRAGELDDDKQESSRSPDVN